MHLNLEGMMGALKKEFSETGVNSAKSMLNFNAGMHGAESSAFGGRSMYGNMTGSLKNILGSAGLSDRMSGNLAHGLIGGAIGATAIGATASAFNSDGFLGGVGTAAAGGAAIAAMTVNPMALGRAIKFGADHISGFDAKGAMSKAHEAVKPIMNRFTGDNSASIAESVVNNGKNFKFTDEEEIYSKMSDVNRNFFRGY